MRFSILCCTNAGRHIGTFLTPMAELAQRCRAELVTIVDGRDAWDRLEPLEHLSDRSILALHGIHAQARQEIPYLKGDYVLVLDDDERCSPALAAWLETDDYLRSPGWQFPRAWLWGDDRHYIISAPHWPDHQRRFARKDYVSVPDTIHAGWLAKDRKYAFVSFPIEHHKLLIQSKSERMATVDRYNTIRPGAGFPDFYLPENYTHIAVGELSA